MDTKTPEYLQSKRRFQEFLGIDGEEGVYFQQIRKVVASSETRLILDITDLRNFEPEQKLAHRLLEAPCETLPAFEDGLRDFIQNTFGAEYDISDVYYIGLTGAFGDHRVTPRGLRAPLLSKLVRVDGIVTRYSLVKPKLVKTIHYCRTTNALSQVEYRDATSFIPRQQTGGIYPKEDANGNPLVTEFGLSTYKDEQILTLQEIPEKSPAGQLPRSVEIILSGDLCDRSKPGDRVAVYGVYRAMAGRAMSVMSGFFKADVIANYIRPISHDVTQSPLTDPDMNNIRNIAARDDTLALISRSLAPSIYGHEFIKQALILQLLGGEERILPNKTHIRGDIHIIMVGDPSTAKSQLLRAMMHVAPLAISTTGRGSSGVGLTAAITTDTETGDRRLEAGAMVLGDRGIVCIDEFDKMSDLDRVAIHEVMEQQTVTIAKAGIHTSLNARCSIVAAANPRYGQYDENLTVSQNVALREALISRFDLLFIVIDSLDPVKDRAVTSHVLRMHRYRMKPGEGHDDDVDDEVRERDEDTPVFQKYSKLLHGKEGRAADRQILTTEFLQKYIQFVKSEIHPILEEQTAEHLEQAYAELRAKCSGSQSVSVTTRTLETMIRLSTAHSKLRLSHLVQDQDLKVAMDLINFALFQQNPEFQAKDQLSEDDEPDFQPKVQRKKKEPESPKPQSPVAIEIEEVPDDPFAFDEEKAVHKPARSLKNAVESSPKRQKVESPKKASRVAPARSKLAQTALFKYFKTKRKDDCTIEEALEAVNSTKPSPLFSNEELMEIIEDLQNKNKVMYRSGLIYLIST